MVHRLPAGDHRRAVLGGLVDVVVIRRFASAPRLILTVRDDRHRAAARLRRHLPAARIALPGGNKGGFISKVDTPWRHLQLRRSAPATSAGTTLRHHRRRSPRGRAGGLLPYTGSASPSGPRRRTPTGPRCSASRSAAVGTVVWMLAGVFAAVTIFLRSTLVGVPVDGTLGPVVLLYALAAAVIARMDSVPVCLGAGIAIGIIDQASVFGTGQELARRRHHARAHPRRPAAAAGTLSRAQDTGVSTSRRSRSSAAIPSELRNVREVVAARTTLSVLLGVFLLAAPFILGPGRLCAGDADRDLRDRRRVARHPHRLGGPDQPRPVRPRRRRRARRRRPGGVARHRLLRRPVRRDDRRRRRRRAHRAAGAADPGPLPGRHDAGVRGCGVGLPARPALLRCRSSSSRPRALRASSGRCSSSAST